MNLQHFLFSYRSRPVKTGANGLVLQDSLHAILLNLLSAVSQELCNLERKTNEGNDIICDFHLILSSHRFALLRKMRYASIFVFALS